VALFPLILILKNVEVTPLDAALAAEVPLAFVAVTV
jgi:hypothetical protein